MANWQSNLAKTQLTREEFQELCAEAIRDSFPGVSIQQLEGPMGPLKITLAGKTHSVFLDNLWTQCRDNALTRVVQVQRFLQALAVAGNADDELPRIESIVPTIKDQVYLDFARRQTGKLSLVDEHLVGDLWIVYAVDSPDAIRSLQQSQLEKLGIERHKLKQVAIENLRRILPPVEQHGGDPYYMLTAGGDYVASLVLFDDLWVELGNNVKGNVVVGIPSRDVLLYTSDKSPEGIAAMRKAIEKITATGGYLVSTTMLRRQSGGWKVFS